MEEEKRLNASIAPEEFDWDAFESGSEVYGTAEKAEIDAVLKELAPQFGVPVHRGFPFGHSPECWTIDFRRRAVIKNGELVFP